MRPSPVRVVVLATANVLGLAAFLWPFLLPGAAGGAVHEVDAPFIMLGLLSCLAVLLGVELGRGGLGPKAVALIGVLGAAMVALRLPGFVAGFSAMFLVVLLAGNAFGSGFGFVLGATGTLASGLFVGGIGPWLPFQMVAVGWVGAGAGLVLRRGPWPLRIGVLAAYGFLAAFAFGAIMNLWFWPFAAGSSALGWDPAAGAADNLRHYAAFYAATSAGWDAFGAVGNAVGTIVLARPLLGALDRAARRMNFRVERVDNERGSRPGGRGRPRPVEESPDSTGQDAGENPRRGDPRKVPQRADRPGESRVRVKG
jgi:energy-coupling factor transport system substrate-specific component